MNFPDRSTALDRLRATRQVDVLIIGGGINGAGLLRELALNGVDALLVDKADFAAGATSASSRMIHGGLRYLENGEFRLVRESLHERNRLLKNAAHAVKPLPTTIPIFSRWSGFTNALGKFARLTSRPAKRGAALIKIGLTFYDLLTASDQVLPKHRFTSRAKALAERPALHPGHRLHRHLLRRVDPASGATLPGAHRRCARPPSRRAGHQPCRRHRQC